MFWGEYSHHLDNKGRLIIPARFRPLLDSGAVLTRGIDHNLVIYPHDVWGTLCQQLNALPYTHPTGRAMRRLLFSGVVEITLDKQGRLLVPAYLREYAALADEVLLVGMEQFIEIWEPRRWQATLNGVTNVLSDTDSELNISL